MAMNENLEPLERLTDMFRRLDGVGRKTAERYAHSVLAMSESDAADFAAAIMAAKSEIRQCPVCHNITTGDLCAVCAADGRDHGTICVVEDTRAVTAIEKTRQYAGVYHVLNGTISPLRRVTPDMLNIKDLLSRISGGDVSEVILATNPTVEGEATAMYIAKLISPLGIKTTRIANGVPVGGDLEFADEVTLRRAIEGRYSIS